MTRRTSACLRDPGWSGILLRGFAARDWSAELDLASLTPLPASYVSRDLRRRHGSVSGPLPRLEEVRTMLAETVQEWTAEWLEQGREQNREQGLSRGSVLRRSCSLASRMVGPSPQAHGSFPRNDVAKRREGCIPDNRGQ